MTPERLAEITDRQKQGADFYERWPVAAYEDVRDLLADNAALRSELARLKEAAELLSKAVKLLGVAQVRLDIPRYEGLHERIDKLMLEINANHIAAALVEQARKEKV